MKSKGQSLENIRQIIASEIAALKSRYHITYMGIFGSYARNEQKETSDIDILVDFDPAFYPGYLDFLTLERHLSDILNSEVDLVTKNSLRKRIGKQIIEEAIVL